VGVFRGKQIGAGKKSVTLTLVFRDPERTLRHERNLSYVMHHTSQTWARGLVEALRAVANDKEREAAAAAAPPPQKL
jgi:trehalose-6-phosphate synthase